MMGRLKELEDENRRLQKMYAEERLKPRYSRKRLKKVVERSRAVRWRKRPSQTK
jgi:hypothetical protein